MRPKVTTLFIQEMARRGVHCNMGFKATLANTEEDIQITARAATEALDMIRTGLDRGTIDSLLQSDLKKEPFRRMVH